MCDLPVRGFLPNSPRPIRSYIFVLPIPIKIAAASTRSSTPRSTEIRRLRSFTGALDTSWFVRSLRSRPMLSPVQVRPYSWRLRRASGQRLTPPKSLWSRAPSPPTARRALRLGRGTGVRRVLSVVVIDACPSRSAIAFGCAPALMASAAAVCRRSWIRSGCTFASAGGLAVAVRGFRRVGGPPATIAVQDGPAEPAILG